MTPTHTPGVYRGGTYAAAVPAVGPARPALPRTGGTVYGGATGLPTSANPDAPINRSGSLTGLILSRGQSVRIQPRERRSRLTKVLAVGFGAIIFVGAIAVVVATLAGDFIRGLVAALVR
jgi:hypothetical protein